MWNFLSFFVTLQKKTNYEYLILGVKFISKRSC